jgi:hypothetical protein
MYSTSFGFIELFLRDLTSEFLLKERGLKVLLFIGVALRFSYVSFKFSELSILSFDSCTSSISNFVFISMSKFGGVFSILSRYAYALSKYSLESVNNFLDVLSTKWHKRETEKSLEF